MVKKKLKLKYFRKKKKQQIKTGNVGPKKEEAGNALTNEKRKEKNGLITE